MGRKRNIALLVIAGVMGLAALAWLLRPRDEPARATVQDAVRSFRAEEDAGGRDGRGGPPPGVYRYATRGSESAQSVLAGATHDYDGVSTITLSSGLCGPREHWQVLSGRWGEVEACDDTIWVTEFHEFFGIGQKDSLRCHGGSRADTLVLEPGARFSSSCEGDGTSISSDWRVIAFEPVRVGGETLDAVHFESRSRLEGESSGSARREEWRRRSDGLLLRLSSESDADSSAGGGTHYSERYTLRLLAATPRR